MLIAKLNLTVPIPAIGAFQEEDGKIIAVGIRTEDLIIYDRKRMDGVLNVSPEVLLMPTLYGKINACHEKGHSATVIFSPVDSDSSLEVEIPYHKAQKLFADKGTELAVAIPPERLFILTSKQDKKSR